MGRPRGWRAGRYERARWAEVKGEAADQDKKGKEGAAAEAEDGAYAGIGFAENLGDDAHEGVADEELAGEAARVGAEAGGAPKAPLGISEKDGTFEGGGVKLGGVAGGDEVEGGARALAGGEDDGPGDGGDFAPEFAVDEVGEAA